MSTYNIFAQLRHSLLILTNTAMLIVFKPFKTNYLQNLLFVN